MKAIQARDRKILLLLFALVQLVLLLWVGIYTKEEALKYVEEAKYFSLHHQFSQPKYFFYSGYIALHLLCNGIGAGVVGVYIIQLIISGIATTCFYSLGIHLGFQRPAAFIATILLIICLPYQKWTVYLFTESYFLSLLLIYTFVLFHKTLSTGKKIIFSVTLLGLIVISRPTGLLMIPATLVLGTVYLVRKRRYLLLGLLFVGGLTGFIFLTNTAMQGQGEFDFIKPFIEEHIICGFPQGGKPADSIQSTRGNDLQGLYNYIIHHFAQFVRLSIERIIAFFGLMRPYFSSRHNFFLAAYFYPLYLFFFLGLGPAYKKSRKFILYSVALVVTFALSVALTCDDWHNRFIMPIVPFIILLAAVGIHSSYQYFISRKDRERKG